MPLINLGKAVTFEVAAFSAAQCIIGGFYVI